MSYENSAMREEEEKLQNWLSTLAEKFENFSNKKMTGEQMLNFLAPDTKMLIDYFMLRYQENPLDTVVAKLLSIYYKSGSNHIASFFYQHIKIRNCSLLCHSISSTSDHRLSTMSSL
jgi:hypothetical protein